MTNPCWTSQDDENLKPTYYYDEGHYPHSWDKVKPESIEIVDGIFRKTGIDYELRDRSVNARNGYTVQCDFIMGLWRDGIDYMKAVGYACHWLAIFNQLNGIEEECVMITIRVGTATHYFATWLSCWQFLDIFSAWLWWDDDIEIKPLSEVDVL